MSATLYAPAFAAITGWTRGDPSRRVRAITAVTLVAGLASTVFAPLTAWLLDPLGWRGTYAVLACFVAATAIAHWAGLRAPWPGRRHAGTNGQRHGIGHQPGATFRRADFWLLVAGMALAGFAVSAVVVNLVPLLTEHGLTVRTAALLLGVGGIGQVAGRLFYYRLARRTGPGVRTWAVLTVVALTTIGLAEVHHPVAVVGRPGLRRRYGPRTLHPHPEPPPSPTAGAPSTSERATESSPAPPWPPPRSRRGRGPFSLRVSADTTRPIWVLAVGAIGACLLIRPTTKPEASVTA